MSTNKEALRSTLSSQPRVQRTRAPAHKLHAVAASAILAAGLFSHSFASAACLNVHLANWPVAGWSANINAADCVTATAAAGLDIATTELASDLRFEADITLLGTGAQASQGGLVFRSSGSFTNGYLLLLHRQSTGSTIELFKNGALLLTQPISALTFGTAYHVKVEAIGGSIKAYFNGATTATLTYTDSSSPYLSGQLGMFHAGTAVRFNNINLTQLSAPLATGATVHSSELGYQTYGEKRAMVRASPQTSASFNVAGATWRLLNSANSAAASGTVGAKVNKWGVDYYPIDFSQVTSAGTYTMEVTIGGFTQTSKPFKIGDTPLMDSSMYTIAVQQLEDRFGGPTPPVMAARGMPYLGGYLPATGNTRADVRLSNNPDPSGTSLIASGSTANAVPPIPQIWIDCASNYTEMGSTAITTRALVDLDALHRSRFSAAQKSAILTNIKRGADYIVGLQETSSDPQVDGRFRHSLYINLLKEFNNRNAFWAGKVYVWNNLNVGAVTLAKAYQALNGVAGAGANAAGYLTAAKKAWKLAKNRPYYLPGEVDIVNSIESSGGPDNWPWYQWQAEARAMYAITDPRWDMGTVTLQSTGYKGLRTRELVEYLWASTLLYQVTDETGAEKDKYLTEAKAVAREIASRQYLNHTQKLAGVHGMFKEFSQSDANTADDNSFLMESAQTGWMHLGHYIYTNLDGFVDLLKLAPNDPDSAKWHRVLQTWAEGYQKPAANANPFKIAPNTVYRDPTGTGNSANASIYWFGNHLHGGSEVWGQAARTLLKVGNYLNDESYQVLANANVQMFAGLNSGFAVAGGVKPSSMFKGIPNTSLANQLMESWAADGSVFGGYTTTPGNDSFWVNFDSTRQLPADAINNGSGESWIAYSHAYVMGAVNLEGAHAVNLDFTNGAAAIGATVSASFPSNPGIATRSYTVPSSGKLSITDLPLGQKVVLTAQTSGFSNLSLPVNTVGGGSSNWVVDFSSNLSGSLSALPQTLSKNTTYTVTWTAMNRGTTAITPAIALSAAGGVLNQAAATASVAPGGVGTGTFTFTTGGAAEPYVIRANFTSGRNVRSSSLTGLIQ
ncbi:cellulase N-terminal Ig-like domain-containing protein [Roseateles sp.]|uniref:cellulase N-terminal Ig-like domain-containing protein n=1 Tax=Roseateles sp. TaxID=1971397 RepID=UPI003D0C4CD9